MAFMPPAFARLSRAVPELARRLPPLALVLVSACSFDPSSLSSGPGGDAAPPRDGVAPVDTNPEAPDAGTDADNRPRLPRDVVHVPENAWLGDDTDVVWNADVDIETTFLNITGPGVAGMPDLRFETSPHEPAGPELAVLYLADWTVAEGVTVRVTGSRPLVVISSGNIELRGVIDASGHGLEPGAGGDLATDGQGAGQDGVHVDSFLDSGGGGAGHATAGARGAHGCVDGCDADFAAGGPGGPVYGDPAVSVLAGGSGGGLGSFEISLDPCLPGAGGGGGGAVQLYAVSTITVAATGGINVGGGGGGAGLSDGCSDSSAGGGGSGGVVYLQAETIALEGVLAANGGGGGSEGGLSGDGVDGADGALSEVPAPGGMAAAGDSAGGAGAAGTSGPQPGADVDAAQNGGGGGGAVGYVVLHCNDFSGNGTISPAPHRTTGCGP